MAILSFGESGSLPKICFARRILYWIVFAWTNKRLAASSYDPKVSTKSAFQNLVGDRRVASKDGQISASIPLFWACSDPHRHLEWRF